MERVHGRSTITSPIFIFLFLWRMRQWRHYGYSNKHVVVLYVAITTRCLCPAINIRCGANKLMLGGPAPSIQLLQCSQVLGILFYPRTPEKSCITNDSPLTWLVPCRWQWTSTAGIGDVNLCGGHSLVSSHASDIWSVRIVNSHHNVFRKGHN